MGAWYHEAFNGAQDASLISMFKAFKARKDTPPFKVGQDLATELLRLWRYIHEKRGEFAQQQAVTADMAREKAPPPPPPPQPGPRAGGAGPAPASKAHPGPKAAAGAKHEPLPAGSERQGGKRDAGRPEAPPPGRPARPGPAGQRQAPPSTPPDVAEASPAPRAAPAAVSIVSFTSTGDGVRDRTVAALHHAITSGGGALDPLDAALALERAAFEAHPDAAGAGYLRRCFLLWGLLSPDSEGFSADVRELLMEGLLAPEKLAALELPVGEQA